MEAIVDAIYPRKDDDESVMNVRVRFTVPEANGERVNNVEVNLFIDKSTDSINEIHTLSLDRALVLLKQIIDRHS